MLSRCAKHFTSMFPESQGGDTWILVIPYISPFFPMEQLPLAIMELKKRWPKMPKRTMHGHEHESHMTTNVKHESQMNVDGP